MPSTPVDLEQDDRQNQREPQLRHLVVQPGARGGNHVHTTRSSARTLLHTYTMSMCGLGVRMYYKTAA